MPSNERREYTFIITEGQQHNLHRLSYNFGASSSLIDSQNDFSYVIFESKINE